MERNLLIKKLLSEGFNTKTLVNLTDKQLNALSVRVLSEQNIKGSVKMKKGTNPIDIKKVTDSGVNVEVVENECDECKKTEVKEENPSKGLTKKQKSNIVKKAKKGEDIGKKGKNFEKISKKAEEKYGSKEKGDKVAAAAMWKNIQKESVMNKMSTTTKGEITELIRQKLNESQNPFEKMTLPEDTDDCVYSDGVSKDQALAQKIANSNARNKFKGKFPGQEFIKNVETAHRTPGGEYRYVVGLKTRNEAGGETDEPFIKDGDKQTEMKEQQYAPATPKTKPDTRPTTKPGERIKPRTPYQPGPGKNPNPKANIPEWMKYDNIKGKK